MIVYASDRNSTGRLTLWAMNADGSGAHRLSRLDALQPSWTAH
ncbi:MAG: hypothetical protein ACXVZO_10310 [Gaiellaceae bacterium]